MFNDVLGMRQIDNNLQGEVACQVYVQSWWPVEEAVIRVGLAWQWAT